MDVDTTQTANIEDVIAGLRKRMENLTPHPDHARHPGPLFALSQKNAITAGFNRKALHQAMMNAYLKDLPARLGLERWLAHYQRLLAGLQNEGAAPAFELAA